MICVQGAAHTIVLWLSVGTMPTSQGGARRKLEVKLGAHGASQQDPKPSSLIPLPYDGMGDGFALRSAATCRRSPMFRVQLFGHEIRCPSGGICKTPATPVWEKHDEKKFVTHMPGTRGTPDVRLIDNFFGP